MRVKQASQHSIDHNLLAATLGDCESMKVGSNACIDATPEQLCNCLCPLQMMVKQGLDDFKSDQKSGAPVRAKCEERCLHTHAEPGQQCGCHLLFSNDGEARPASSHDAEQQCSCTCKSTM